MTIDNKFQSKGIMQKIRDNKIIKRGLLTLGFITSFGLGYILHTPEQIPDEIKKTRSNFLPQIRYQMFFDNEGLPDWFKTDSGKGYPGFIHEQRSVIRSICLNGEYSPEVGDYRYINPTRALALLDRYGWDTSNFWENYYKHKGESIH